MNGKVRILIPKEAGTANYVTALINLGAEPVCVASGETDAAGYDGLLLTGGGDIDPAFYGEQNNGSEEPDRERDRYEMNVCRMFIRARKPILGICRGHQLLNVCLGGTLIQDLQVKAHHSRMGGNDDKIHPCFAAKGSVAERIYGGSFVTNSAHHQAIKTTGNGLKVTMTSWDGVVEAVEHTELPIIGVQWHPERMCFDHFRNDGSADGSLVMEAFLNMCGR